MQNYFIFIPAKKYIKCFSGSNDIYSWKSNGMSEKSIENINKIDYTFAPTLVSYPLPYVKFDNYCLINNNIFIPKKVINLYIYYTLDPWSRDLDTDFTLGNCLFGSVKYTKNTDPDKYKYSGYAIGFDSRSKFSLTDGSMGKNVFIFGADMNSSVHIVYKKDMLILDEGPTQRLVDTTLTAEAKCPINFTQSRKKICIKSTLQWKQQFLIC